MQEEDTRTAMRQEERLLEEQAPKRAEEQYLNGLDRIAAALPERQWKAWQIGGGIALGIGGGICLLYMGNTQTFGSMGLLMAVLVMLLVPNLLQRNLTRSIHMGRMVSVGAFAAMLAAHLIRNWPQS